MKKNTCITASYKLIAVIAAVIIAISSKHAVITNASPDYPKDEAYVLTSLYIREAPDGKICGKYKQGDKVKVIDYDGDWAKTNNGYCWAGFLSEQYSKPNMIMYDNMKASRYVGDLYEIYCGLPENLRTMLDKFNVILCSNKIKPASEKEEDKEKPALTGLTKVTHKSKIIKIKASSKVLKKAFIHEVGHAVDEMYNESKNIVPSETQAFADAKEKEKKILKKYFECSDEEIAADKECFAEVFRIYMTDKEEMEEKMPVMYEYIERIVDDM